MGRNALRRVRWANLALCALGLTAAIALSAWAFASTPGPALPADAPRPLVPDEPAWEATPRGGGGPNAASNRGESDGEAGESGRGEGRGGGPGRTAADGSDGGGNGRDDGRGSGTGRGGADDGDTGGNGRSEGRGGEDAGGGGDGDRRAGGTDERGRGRRGEARGGEGASGGREGDRSRGTARPGGVEPVGTAGPGPVATPTAAPRTGGPPARVEPREGGEFGFEGG